MRLPPFWSWLPTIGRGRMSGERAAQQRSILSKKDRPHSQHR
jgi:hypothetical protein